MIQWRFRYERKYWTVDQELTKSELGHLLASLDYTGVVTLESIIGINALIETATRGNRKSMEIQSVQPIPTT